MAYEYDSDELLHQKIEYKYAELLFLKIMRFIRSDIDSPLHIFTEQNSQPTFLYMRIHKEPERFHTVDEMPEDPANRLAVSVHYYTPSDFAILEKLEYYMNLLQTNFVDHRIPVIIGEYGCPKNNKEEESVRLFLFFVCEAAYSRGICPILWDITDLHYDRTNCEIYDDTLMQLLLSVKETEKFIIGDVNSDGTFDENDVVMLQQ